MGLRYPHQGSGSTSDLDHPISALQFGQAGTDDSLFASMSASMVANATSSAVPIYIFKANNSNNNNTDEIQITVVLKSSIPAKSYGGGPHASGREIRLEVYNNDASPNWDPVATNTTALADTDITLTGTVTGATSTISHILLEVHVQGLVRQIVGQHFVSGRIGHTMQTKYFMWTL